MAFCDSPYTADPIPEEERDELAERFVKLFNDHGRNFINLYRERFLRALQAFDACNDEPYITEPVLEAEIIGFRTLTLAMEGMYTGITYSDFFERAERTLKRRDEIAAGIGMAPEQKDWVEWSKYIVKKCNELDKKFSPFFRTRLFEFFTPMRSNLDFARNELKVPSDPLPLEDRPTINFQHLMQEIEDLKTHEYCGYMYGILEEWVLKIGRTMRRSFPETLPGYRQISLRPMRSQEKKPVADDFQVEEQKPFVFKPWPNLYNGFSNYKIDKDTL